MKLDKFYKKYSTAIKPIIAIVVSIIVSLISSNQFWTRISDIRAEIAQNSNQNDILNSRLNTLQSSVADVRESSNLLSFALPSSNPAVIILNHIYSVSSSNEVILDNLSTNIRRSPLEEVGINAININFDLLGNYNDIYNVIAQLSKISPIVNLDSAEIKTDKKNISQASIRLTGFYAPFPTKLPPITSPLEDFTDQEKSTINLIQTFAKPDTLLLLPSGSQDLEFTEKGKQDPFSQFVIQQEDILEVI